MHRNTAKAKMKHEKVAVPRGPWEGQADSTGGFGSSDAPCSYHFDS